MAHLIGWWFAYNPKVYLTYVVLLVGFVTPLVLFHITRTWQTVLFYYATQYFWFMTMTVSQALASIFFVGLFLTKNNYLRFLFFIAGMVSHGQGFMLLGVAWFVLILFEAFDGKKLFPACGSLLGKAQPEIVKAQVGGPEHFGLTVGVVLNFFLKIMPFPFLFFGLKQLWREKHFAPLALVALVVISTFFTNHRSLYIIPLLVLPYTARYCSLSAPKLRHGFYLLAVALIALQAWSWVQVKIACV